MSLVIMTHADRLATAHRLAERLDADVRVDPASLFRAGRVGPPNALRCARLAWSRAALDRRDDWAAVFQDDAQPAPFLDSKVIDQLWRRACDAYGEPVALSFFYGAQSATGSRIRRRLELTTAGAHTRTSRSTFVVKPLGEYLATVACVVPRAWVADWHAFSLTRDWFHSTRDDECWGTFLDAHDRLSVATVPCLVQHDNALPSVAGNEEHGPRVAATPIPEELPAWFT